MTAGRDLTLSATQVGNFGEEGHTVLSCGQDFRADAVAIGGHDEVVWDADNYVKQGDMTDIGTQISTMGSAELRVGRHFDSQALQVRSNLRPLAVAERALALEAGTELAATTTSAAIAPTEGAATGLQVSVGGHLTIQPGRATRHYERATKQTRSGILGNSTTSTYERQRQDMAMPSSFSGEQIVMEAGVDETFADGQLTLKGSHIVSEQGTALIAERIKIISAEQYQQQFSYRQEEKSGLFSSGGLSVTLGSQESSQQQRLEGTQQQSSAVGSLCGDVRIRAKRGLLQLGSHLVAPQGTLEVSADTVEVLDSQNQQQLTQESSSHCSGLTLSVSNPALSAVQTALQLESAVSQTDDPRMQALAVAAGGLAAKNTYDVLTSNPQQLVGVNVSISLGQSESQSYSRQSCSSAQRSQVVGRNIIIQARAGDAQIQGDVQAAEQAQISASGQLHLLASANRSEQQSEQHSSSSSIEVGTAVTVGVSLGRGSSQGASCSYDLAQVSASQQLMLQSGGDTLVQGVMSGGQIQSKVGGHLTVESLQDTDHQEGQQRCLSASVSFAPSYVSGQLNYSQNSYRSDFATVQQQAGLQAGDGGFQLQVAGNTHLEGAVIASSDKAIAAGCNQLESGTLTQRAIENRADYTAQSIGLGVGVGFSQSAPKSEQPALEDGVEQKQSGQAVKGAQQGLSAMLPIVIGASGSASSSTYSGISGARQAVTITDKAAQQALTGQSPEQTLAVLEQQVKAGSHALKPLFNQQEIAAGFQIVGILTREVGCFLENRAKEADSKQALAKRLTAQAQDPSNNLSAAQRQSLADQANELKQQAQWVSKKWGAGGI